MRWGRWAALLAIVVATGVFAALNSGERTALNLGVATIYRVSVVRLVLGSFLLGMVTMFLVGLRQDLRLRRLLRRHGLVDSRGMIQEPRPPEPHRPHWDTPVAESAPHRID